MADELRDEHRFDYLQAQPNRFAATAPGPVRLAADVAAAFADEAAVNAALREYLRTHPPAAAPA